MWQPIETAPIGQNILIWLPAKDQDGNDYNVWPAVITAPEDDEESDPWIDIPDWSQGGVGFAVGEVKPLYWMPQPSPPVG